MLLMDKSTISMAIFNSKLLVYQRVPYMFGITIHPGNFQQKKPNGLTERLSNTHYYPTSESSQGGTCLENLWLISQNPFETHLGIFWGKNTCWGGAVIA